MPESSTRTRRLVAASTYMLVLVLCVSLLVLYQAIQTSRTTDQLGQNANQIRMNSDLSSCRAKYAQRLASANSKLNASLYDGLIAVATNNDAALTALITPDGSGLSKADRIKADVQHADRLYGQAAAEVIRDPEGFLAECARQAN